MPLMHECSTTPKGTLPARQIIREYKSKPFWAKMVVMSKKTP